ncbi:RDD family protein [Fibrella arboris]|uniref:RDD family protein n=1 Tax=Fibrella arboris TaxID=3242486 RepID=UPI0035227F66
MEPTPYSSTTPVLREKASAIIRFVALFIDSIVAYVPMIVLGIVSSKLATLGYLAALAYLLTRDSLPFLNGQSVGKKLMGIKVIREDTGAGIMGDYGTGVVRAIPQMIPLLNLVDALVIFRDSTKRFGDEWAKTIVVKA